MSVRTFDFAPVVPSLPPSSSPEGKIESMAFAGEYLFLGTSDGWIHRYTVHLSKSVTGRSLFHSRLMASKRMTSKKPVVKVQVIEGINRVLYLCDGLLAMLDAATVEIVPNSASKMKNVSAFSLNDRIHPENPFISYEVCVGKKKMLQIVQVTESQLTLLREISLGETALHLVYSEPFVCFASTTHYHIVNVKETSQDIHHLFPYPDIPVITSLTDSDVHEFLLSGPGGLGMFVSAQTLVAPRPPINWAEVRVTRIQYAAPYILVYSNEHIWVYSSINQQPKQSLQFDRCAALCQAYFQTGGHATPLMASHSQVWAMETVPWQEQVDALLEDKRVDEALEIARSYSSEESRSSEYFRSLLQRAALVQLHRHELRLAKELLLECQCSPHFILAYCPDLYPQADTDTSSPFYIDIFASSQPAAVRERNEFLISYLQSYRALYLEFSPEMNLVLLKLYTQSERHLDMMALAKSYRTVLPYQESKVVLEEAGRLVALAFFELRMGHAEEALTLLKDVYDQVRMDSVDGDSVTLATLVDILKSSTDEKSLSIKSLPWLLKKDQSIAVDILKHLSLAQDITEDIDGLLDEYPSVRYQLLEYLVFDRKSRKEKVLAELAAIYLEELSQLSRAQITDEAWQIRGKLQSILRLPSFKKSESVVKLIDEMQLHEEKVILLAKDGEHFAALDLLAHQLKDRAGAVDYCVQYGSSDKSLKRQLFEHLLAIYFNPKEQNEESVRAALELLNDEEADFDPSKVLSILPANWPLQCLHGFLSHTLRRSLHTQRTGAVECGLSKSLYYSAYLYTVRSAREKMILSDERRCHFCKKRFLHCSFKRLTDGHLSHIECSQSTQSGRSA